MSYQINNLISLYQQNRFNEAMQVASRVIGEDPTSHQAHNIMGLIFLSNKVADKALLSFEKAVGFSPKMADYQYNLSLAYSFLGKPEKAEKILTRVVKKNKQYFLAYNALGSIYFDQKNHINAIKNFKLALDVKPDYIDALYNLANVYRVSGEYALSAKYYSQLYKLNKNDHESKLSLVRILMLINKHDDALIISENDSNCLYEMAKYEESKSHLKNANCLIDKSLSLDKDNLKYILLKATVLRRLGEINEAKKIIDDSGYHVDSDEEIETRICMEFELGNLYDKDKDYDNAFRHYSLANKLNNQVNPVDSPAAKKFIQHLDCLNETLSESWIASLEFDYAYTPPRNVMFMVAFPRSGTTLLDQVLDGHSELVVMEELPIIGDVIKEAIRITGGSYPELLSNINKNTLNKLRKYYFKRVDEQFKYDKRKILVDKLPLNIIEIELIHLLFPRAKVVLSMRHPYDVCLSNFMQHYAANEAMVSFNTLNSTSGTYHKVMRLWDKYISLLSTLQNHIVRYESLVENMESEVIDLIEFLELKWEPGILDFHKHALERKALNTPSYQQVTQPLYTSSRYRWKNYADYIIDDFRCLDEYVEKFGYELRR